MPNENAVSLLSVLLVGFLLGLRHATDADHLAAMATLASGRATLAQSVRQGVAWGIGHAATLTLCGGVVLLLGKTIPHGLAQGLELAVALMLIVLGGDVLRRLATRRVHFHAHHHEDIRHVHAHSHTERTDEPDQNHSLSEHRAQRHDHGHGFPSRALLIGMMHGLAGTAALILLSLDAVTSLTAGVAYIVLFGLGSVAGMALLSVAIALPLRLAATQRLTRNLTWLHAGSTAAVGAFSCLLGVFMIQQIAFA